LVLLVPCETSGGANEAPQVDLFGVPELRGSNAHPDQPINAVFGLFLREELTLVLLVLCATRGGGNGAPKGYIFGVPELRGRNAHPINP
jgi:hypothetical protein